MVEPLKTKDIYKAKMVKEGEWVGRVEGEEGLLTLPETTRKKAIKEAKRLFAELKEDKRRFGDE